MRHQLVQGVGINDVLARVKGCPFYAVWLAMFQRCYSAKMLTKNPAYLGCTVAPDWHYFSDFRRWMLTQDWTGKVLDKDIRIPGNKVYGPTTCLFVSHKVNGLLNTQQGQRGDLPLGVARCGDRFKVTFKKDKKTVHLGVYDTVEDASSAYGRAKGDWVLEHALRESCPYTKAALIQAAANYRKGIP